MNFSHKGTFGNIYNDIYGKCYSFKPLYTDKKPLNSLNNTYTPTDSHNSDFSIENLLNSESEALFDKTKTIAKAIFSRLDIHSYISYLLDYNSLKIRNEILEFERLFPSKYCPSIKSKDSLTTQLINIDQQKLVEKVKCWQDILKPVSEFISLYHQYKEIKQDKKLLDEK